ncbi:MAG TPA: hypothetical protein VMT57_00620 [Candidatus Thermoplasmatota archaeon]|nr:hypothetical protein [Candidatus Thermoplasmatota archaeon]
MVVGPKPHRKKDEVDYQRVLDKTDPFDQLIMELGRGGVLDISVVPIEQEHRADETSGYNKKVLPMKGKHSA